MATPETNSIKGPRPNARYAEALQTGLAVWARYVVWVQGAYYLIMGLWPILNILSFESVTGPKTDIWLVKTVGLLVIVSGFVLILAAYRRSRGMEIGVLGVGDALALIVIELVYVSLGTISPIYLLDTFIQILFIIGWFQRGPRNA